MATVSRAKEELVAEIERRFKDRLTGPEMLELIASKTRRALKDCHLEGSDSNYIVSINQRMITDLLMRTVRNVAEECYEMGSQAPLPRKP